MYLKQLMNSGFAGFDEWRDMWNRDILPYLRGLRPLAGRGVRTEQKPDGTMISAVATTGAAATRSAEKGEPYDSYFKLKLTAGDSGTTVRIADGATDGDSVAVVNGYTRFTLAPYTETVTADRLFFLKFTPPVYAGGGAVATPATMEICSAGEDGDHNLILPRHVNNGPGYFQLGRVLFRNGAARAIQDHTAGVADVRWYVTGY